MLWTSITQKLRHLLKIVLTYLAYESNLSLVVNYLNYTPFLLVLVLTSLFV